MKITKQQLRKLIKETYEELEEELPWGASPKDVGDHGGDPEAMRHTLNTVAGQVDQILTIVKEMAAEDPTGEFPMEKQ